MDECPKSSLREQCVCQGGRVVGKRLNHCVAVRWSSGKSCVEVGNVRLDRWTVGVSYQ